jgi:hypothetical protein
MRPATHIIIMAATGDTTPGGSTDVILRAGSTNGGFLRAGGTNGYIKKAG